jgi:hypothetical protein
LAIPHNASEKIPEVFKNIYYFSKSKTILTLGHFAQHITFEKRKASELRIEKKINSQS